MDNLKIPSSLECYGMEVKKLEKALDSMSAFLVQQHQCPEIFETGWADNCGEVCQVACLEPFEIGDKLSFVIACWKQYFLGGGE